MPKPKNLFYNFNNIPIDRNLIDDVIKEMDKIAELPPRENMDLEQISRVITPYNNPIRYVVRDIQMRNPIEKTEIDYTCYIKSGETIKIQDWVQY